MEKHFVWISAMRPLAFSIAKIPVYWLSQQSRGYKMDPPGSRDVIRAHGLFVPAWKRMKEKLKKGV